MEAMRAYDVMTEERTTPMVELAPMHRLAQKPLKPTGQRVYYKPDEDLYRSVSVEEVLEGVLEDIHEFYAGLK